MKKQLMYLALFCFISAGIVFAGGNKKTVPYSETYSFYLTKNSTSEQASSVNWMPNALVDLNINLSLSTYTSWSPCTEWVICDSLLEGGYWVDTQCPTYHPSSCTVTVNVYNNNNWSTPFYSEAFNVTNASPVIQTRQFESPGGYYFKVEYVMTNNNINPNANFINNSITCTFTE